MSEPIELPCVKCSNAAVRVDLSGAVDLVPGKYLYGIKGAARLAGKPLNTDSPSLGLDPAEISQVIGATCIDCVDAEKVSPFVTPVAVFDAIEVDNNHEATK